MNSNINSDKKITQNDINNPYFKKYLVSSGDDIKWGFIINDAGYQVIPPNSGYPLKGHPGSYMFSWDKGRTLNIYQFVLIRDGEGVFESKSAGKLKINDGDGFWLFPGEWHRYKPSRKTGWTEYWVGFSGDIPDNIMKQYFFSKEKPVISKSDTQLVLKFFHSLFGLIKDEPFGYQRSASGICYQLIAETCNIQRGEGYKKQHRTLISKAIYIMNEKIEGDIDFKKLSANLGISYSKFRTDFKRQTGFSPLQYFLLLKIEKAKDLLANTYATSKQIAFDLGFESDHYFCRLFKAKTSFTPKQFRKSTAGITTGIILTQEQP